MAAMLAWDLSSVTINGRPMTDEDQRALFGKTFEQLGQERRVKVLRAYGLISPDAGIRFDQVRQVRRQYLHFLSQDHGDIAKHAVAAFAASASIVAEIIGQEMTEDGTLKVNPKLVRFLDRAGLIQQTPNNSTAGQAD